VYTEGWHRRASLRREMIDRKIDKMKEGIRAQLKAERAKGIEKVVSSPCDAPSTGRKEAKKNCSCETGCSWGFSCKEAR
jgi:hypothetical protein